MENTGELSLEEQISNIKKELLELPQKKQWYHFIFNSNLENKKLELEGKLKELQEKKNIEDGKIFVAEKLEEEIKEVITESIKNIVFNSNIVQNEVSNKNNEIPLKNEYDIPKISKSTKNKIEYLNTIIDNIEKIQNDNKVTTFFENKNYKINYEKELNERQLEAVQTIENPLLIIAGAGTGKTKTLSYRVAYMLENDINPENILLLTFTRKAAKEMIDRTKMLLQLNNINIQGGTFHSFANIVLRKYYKLLGIQPNFTIIDTIDSEDIIDLIKRDLDLKTIKDKGNIRKSTIQKIISKSRNLQTTIKKVIKKEYLGYEDFSDDINIIYEHYIEYNKKHFIYDYDDLLIALRDSLKTNKEFKEILQNKYKYIMVDEFQDTNIIQKEIVDLLSDKYKNIMVVGDDSQSIYSFRGANYENILRFPEKYPDCKIIKLEKNYRSRQDILNFSNNIINNFTIGYKKELYSDNKSEAIVDVKRFFDQEKEAEWIAGKIVELHNQNISLNNIAVLYRAGFHSNFLQVALTSKMINFVVYGGIKFSERKHIKDIMAYLKIILNPLDIVSWNRILNRIEGIGNVTARKVVNEIEKNNGIINFYSFKNKKYFSELIKLGDTIKNNTDDNISVVKKIENLKLYYEPIIKDMEDDYKDRLLDIDVLITLAVEYNNNLEKFISDFALDPPSNKIQQESKPLIGQLENEALTLSTVHSAKGLEWEYVFVIHMLDGLFPSERALENIETLDEERRLFYVACTRAKSKLYITMPSVISQYNYSIFDKPSRFISEINNKYYNYSLDEYTKDEEDL
ncbi:ATP-dependent helicase [Brachyspira hyodysenteriae]|uniref:ATP-dependent helicase n=1 Tax=Brachyspira hyodysenteriae TaxID=159 RepID=UPI002B263851|nr:ATP-dependent helicase [Brachyspira hyodysenteriae]WPC38697.1 ATP-dependent helicase [Brachyspira hyodysenteriae]